MGPIYLSTNSGLSWTPSSAPIQFWTSVASSADGVRLLAACADSTNLFLSTNSGLTWTPTGATTNNPEWYGVASSADGSKLLALGFDDYSDGYSEHFSGFVYQSSDSGLTWTESTEPVNYYVSLACSADGNKWVATPASASILAPVAAGPEWTPSSAPITNWTALASSADGARMIAATGYTPGGLIYTSSDSGATWASQNAPNAFWETTACSADGAILGAATSSFGNHQIFISTDSGNTWSVTTAPQLYWRSIAMSADGSKWVAMDDQGAVYVSTNSSASWSPANLSPPRGYGLVLSSADGTTFMAFNGAGIFTTTNSGSTWTQVESAGVNAFVASSADARKLVACSVYGPISIDISADSGATWTATGVPYENWTSVASSADGTHLAATANNYPHAGQIATSTDGGVTWTLTRVPGKNWGSIACSADGNKLVAQTDNVSPSTPSEEIYTSQSTPTPTLSLTASGANSLISWTIPSASFRLQQNSSLATTNWTTVTNTPALNLNCLQYQVVLARTNGNHFFRLAHP